MNRLMQMLESSPFRKNNHFEPSEINISVFGLYTLITKLTDKTRLHNYIVPRVCSNAYRLNKYL
jgi:hypothetical protein